MRVSSLLVWGRTPPSVRPGNARRCAPMLYAGLRPTSRSCSSSSPSPPPAPPTASRFTRPASTSEKPDVSPEKCSQSKAVPKASISWISVKMLWPVLSPSWSKRPERCRRRPPPSRTHHRDPRSPEGLRRPPRNHPQPHQPDRGRRRHHPSATQELRCGKPWPLQCRSIASNKKAHEDEGQAEHHRDLWQ
jgi:hypothetical protein